MANRFPPILDHEDQFFPPSDMFLRTRISYNHHPHRSSFLGSSSSLKEELDIARRLAALSLLQKCSSRATAPFFAQQPPPPPPSTTSQRVKQPMGRSVSLNHAARGSRSLHETGGRSAGASLAGVGRLRGNGTGILSSRANSVYEPEVRPKIERYLEAKRASACVQRQQNRFPGRIYPFHGNRLGTRAGDGGREFGGTGVFHPRVADDNHPTTITDDKMKRGGRVKRGEVQVAQQREETMDTMRRFGVSSKQEEDCHYHLPPDLGLPREWTY